MSNEPTFGAAVPDLPCDHSVLALLPAHHALGDESPVLLLDLLEVAVGVEDRLVDVVSLGSNTNGTLNRGLYILLNLALIVVIWLVWVDDDCICWN